jgi:VWFA-related protein
MKRTLRFALFLVSFATPCLPAWTQSPSAAATTSAAPLPQRPEYTLDTGTRLVIDDVAVTDKNGHAVTGLPQSAFHLQDDGIEQRIRNFNETSGPAPIQPSSTPAGAFSNASLYSANTVVTAMLLDPVSIGLPDQMYLRLQMLHYLKTMPEGTQVAVFRANSDGMPVLIQSLTSDRALLVAAMNSSVPAIMRPTDAFANAVAEIENIADYLHAIPGKKVLLWFGGRFPLYLNPDDCSALGSTAGSSSNAIDCSQRNDIREQITRALEQSRIAVYPIDVRGVLVDGPPMRPTVATSQQPGSVSGPRLGEGTQAFGQYDAMDQIATATGGRAYRSNNDISAAIASAITIGSSSYTLTYRPQPYSSDGHWHNVRITVDGPYTVAYRDGYYASGAASSTPRTLLANKRRPSPPGTTQAPSSADAGAATIDPSGLPPIVFNARISRQQAAGKQSLFSIEYTIPTDQLNYSSDANGVQHARFRLIALAYDSDGQILGNAIDNIETSYTATQMQLATRIGTPANQTVATSKGSQFLLLAVQDIETQRIGTVQLSMHSVSAAAAPTR